MKKFLLFVLLIPFNVKSQTYFIPTGLSILKGYADKELKVVADFDRDGSKDVVFLAADENENVYFLFGLTSTAKLNLMELKKERLDFSDCCSYIDTKNGLITISTKGNRFFENFRIQYNNIIKSFEIISYHSESFGNAAQDGSGSTDFNFLNGKLEMQYNTWNRARHKLIVGPKKSLTKKPSKRYLIPGFNEAIAFIEKLTTENPY